MRIRRGDTEIIDFELFDGDGNLYSVEGDALEIWFGAKRNKYTADGSAEIMKLMSTSGITVSGNLLSVTINPTDTSTLPGRDTELYYELQVKDSSAKIYTLASGRLVVEADVVRYTS